MKTYLAKWEKLINYQVDSIYRLKVPGGWLVKNLTHGMVTFFPDPNHEWKPEEVEVE